MSNGECQAIGLIVLFVIAILLFVLVIHDDSNSGLGRAQSEAHIICLEKGGAVTYDVQDEYKMVYACRKDGKLHVINYENY